MRIDEPTRDNVVQMYSQGVRIDDIVAETGVKRPTIYYILRQRGLRPTRTARNTPGPDLHDLLAQLAAAQRDIGKLEQQRDTTRNVLAKILAAVATEDPAMAEVLTAAVDAAGIDLEVD